MMIAPHPTASTDEADRLATLADYGLLDTTADPRFDAIVRDAAGALGASGSTVTLIDRDRQWFKARLGVEVPETPIADSICAHVVCQQDVLVVEDAAADDRFRAMAGVAGAPGIRFYAGAPLTLRNGVRVGTLCVFDDVSRADFDDADRAMLQQLASRTVAEFELDRDFRREGRAGPADEGEWLELAGSLLARASVALERCDATRALAQLAPVLAEIGELSGTEPI